MNLDVLLLSRLQFAITIGFHFIFPPLSIGLAWFMVIFEFLGWKKNDKYYIEASKFFGKILALLFAVGVATGIVMEFQFGTNWAEYSKFVGDIFGAPLAAEGIFAFFLESTFLGLYLFGRDKVSKSVHWFSILMVAIGSTLSAFWILVANSWQQTPTGFVVKNGRAEMTNFYETVFNPSMMIRFEHTMIACFVAGAFLVIGVSAFLLIKKRNNPIASRTLKIGLIVGFIASMVTAFPTGHYHVETVAHTQPEKFATMECLFVGTENAPLTIFGIPSDEPRDLKMRISIPNALSIMTHDDPNAYVVGMSDLEKEGWEMPPFSIVVLSFHLMMVLGVFFILLTAAGLLFYFIKPLKNSKLNELFLRILPFTIPLPIIAIELGWILAEVGRQPWVVYHVLKTRDAFSTNVSGGEILTTIIAFSLIYLLLGSLFLFVLNKIVRKGPDYSAVEGV
jgi:cytochrome bd ubiquinol oxidase subunit I